VRKLGHVYLEWPATDRILYAKSELQKLHHNYSHPSTQNLFALLKRAKDDNVDANTRSVLSDIENACSICQHYSSKALRLKTTLPSGEELSFGSELSMDLMFINGKAVLHVIDFANSIQCSNISRFAFRIVRAKIGRHMGCFYQHMVLHLYRIPRPPSHRLGISFHEREMENANRVKRNHTPYL
jgi:hypothetical protein